MQRNVLEYLEQIVKRLPDKTAYADEKTEMTFAQVSQNALAIGTFLREKGLYKQPVVVFMGKHPRTIAAFFGVVYAGCYYVPIDEEMPSHRIELIFKSLDPGAVICDSLTAAALGKFGYQGQSYLYDEMICTPVREDLISRVRDRQIDTDPIYIVFTSGSTGIPKGVVACHRSVIDYIENLSSVLGFNEDTVFGNQTPLYVDACLKELYPTLKFGATTYFIPKELFMFPLKLVEYLNDKKINTICWVVSALTIISSFGTFDRLVPKYLKTIAFGSEVFPIKQFNLWRKNLPEARFVNLYGPTEATGMSCYYEVDREFEPGEMIPIGRPFSNTDILLLDENNREASFGEPGEICIRGTPLTLGYYKDFERTGEAFVQNPLNNCYPELIYRTGDIGRYNERGELEFISRKDNQIKHMGHRIELGEIELAANMHMKVNTACCIFDGSSKKIVLYYVGDAAKAEVAEFLKEKLPRYMVPNVIESLDMMPLTANGKIDRVFLKEKYSKR